MTTRKKTPPALGARIFTAGLSTAATMAMIGGFSLGSAQGAVTGPDIVTTPRRVEDRPVIVVKVVRRHAAPTAQPTIVRRVVRTVAAPAVRAPAPSAPSHTTTSAS